MTANKKILYTASTIQHIKNFHVPYIIKLLEMNFEVHIGARGAESFAAEILTGENAAAENAEVKNAEVGDMAKERHFQSEACFNHPNCRLLEIPFDKNMASRKNVRAAIALAEHMKEEHYAIINTHTSLAAFFTRLAVRLSNTKKTLKHGAAKNYSSNSTVFPPVAPYVVNTVHGYLFDEQSPWLKKNILLLAEKLMASVTDKILVMNGQDLEIAKKHRLCGGGRVNLIPGMGIDGTKFRTPHDSAYDRAAARESLGLPKDGFLMIYAAEFSKRKNQRMLINAMDLMQWESIISDAKAMPFDTDITATGFYLLLAGDGDLLSECKALTKELHLEKAVLFLGYIKDMKKYYDAADVCVTSSRSEGLPFNVMEAMASGLPVVATDVKGHEDLIEDGRNGYLYPYDDQVEFCEKVKLLEYADKKVKRPENANRKNVIGDAEVIPTSISMTEDSSVDIYCISDAMIERYLKLLLGQE